MHITSRRNLLKITSASLSLIAGGRYLAAAGTAHAADAEFPRRGGQEFLLVCDTPKKDKDRNIGVTVTNPGSIKGLNVATRERFEIEIPFFGHTVTQNPRRPSQVVSFEKWGRRAALVDILEKRVLEVVEAPPNNVFFGHAAYDAPGSLMVTSEDDYNRSQGQLTLRDATNLKLIQKFSSHGVNPHECMSSADGKIVMVVNEGRGEDASNLAWIELQSGKLLNKVVFENEVSGRCSHLDISFDNWVFAGGNAASQDKPGAPRVPMAFVSPEGQVFRPRFPDDIYAKMSGEALSIAFVGHSGLAAVTLPNSNMVLLLDYKTQELVSTIEVPEPKGLVSGKDEHSILIGSSKTKELYNVSFAQDTHKAGDLVLDTDFGGLGSHIARILV